jgi:hypothetical protein
MPETVTDEAPKVDLLADRGIVTDDVMGELRDVEYLDGVSDTVGQRGYLSPYTAEDCLLPAASDSEQRPAATFDRYYFPTDDGQEQVLVDVVLAGAARDEQEAAKHVAIKRDWCKARGMKYLVVLDGESYS